MVSKLSGYLETASQNHEKECQLKVNQKIFSADQDDYRVGCWRGLTLEHIRKLMGLLGLTFTADLTHRGHRGNIPGPDGKTILFNINQSF